MLKYVRQHTPLSIQARSASSHPDTIMMYISEFHDVFRYGGRQAGIFCALYTLHQELQNEDAVDVYKTVRLYAAKRPGIFKSKVGTENNRIKKDEGFV